MNEAKNCDGSDFTTTIHNDTYPAIDPLQLSKTHRRRCVFVTGASKGIGKRTAIAFAEAGATHIAIGARSSLDEVESDVLQGAVKGGHPPPQVLKIKLDVTDQKSIESAAANVLKVFGSLDILINNAGYLETFLPIADSDPSEWWRTWDMNLRSIYLCTKFFLPILLKGGEKTIINIGSIGAHHFMPGGSSYQTSKLALLRFTEFTMLDHGTDGILAYAVHPGGIPTEISSRMPSHITSKVLIDTAELASDTLVWLSQERREWLAGRYISCTWDMPELEAMRDEIVKSDKLKLRMVV